MVAPPSTREEAAGAPLILPAAMFFLSMVALWSGDREVDRGPGRRTRPNFRPNRPCLRSICVTVSPQIGGGDAFLLQANP